MWHEKYSSFLGMLSLGVNVCAGVMSERQRVSVMLDLAFSNVARPVSGVNRNRAFE